MPVRGAGVATLCSLKVRGSEAGRGIAGEAAGYGCLGREELLGMLGCSAVGLIYKEEEAVSCACGWGVVAVVSPAGLEGVERNMEALEVLAAFVGVLGSGTFPPACCGPSSVVGLLVAGIYRDVKELTGALWDIGAGRAAPGDAGEKGGAAKLCPPRLSLLFLGAEGLKMTEEVIGHCPKKPGVKGRADLLKMPAELGEGWAPSPPMVAGEGGWN